MRSPFRRRLKPLWTFDARGEHSIIWKLLISPSGILTGEERDTTEKRATLFAIDVTTGRVLWRGVEIGEPWWFNSERATTDTLYVQTFRKPDLPEPQGIIALDIRTGRERWRQPEMTFLFEHDARVFASRLAVGRKEYFAMDAMTGEITRQLSGADALEQSRPSERPDSNSLFANALSPNDPLLTHLHNAQDRAELRGGVDHIAYRQYHIMSFHTRARASAESTLANKLTNELTVFDSAGWLRFRETIEPETLLPLPENFFVSHGLLIYVKEQRTLVGVDLRK